MPRIYLSIYGGLGNQLYILAWADYLRRTRGITPRIYNPLQLCEADQQNKDRSRRDLFLELIKSLGFHFVQAESREHRLLRRWARHIRHHREELGKHGIFLGEQLPPLEETRRWCLPGILTVDGYFQSHHYLSMDFRKRVATFLRAQCSHSDQVSSYAQSILPQDVAIHLRRGDFLQVMDAAHIFGAEHYLHGLSLLEKQEAIGRVFVFSDDFEAIAPDLERLGTRYELIRVEGMTPIEDMCLLGYFRRYVLANSTFSWWGAFCSSSGDAAEVVVPSSPLKRVEKGDSFYPPHWIKI